jgi:hypothetical protein
MCVCVWELTCFWASATTSGADWLSWGHLWAPQVSVEAAAPTATHPTRSVYVKHTPCGDSDTSFRCNEWQSLQAARNTFLVSSSASFSWYFIFFYVLVAGSRRNYCCCCVGWQHQLGQRTHVRVGNPFARFWFGNVGVV